MRIHLVALLVPALGSVAHADDGKQAQRDDDDFIPLAFVPEIGVGVVGGHGKDVGFDGTLRWGLTGRLADWFRPGGFIDVHTVDFDTMDAAVGAQVQTRLWDENALVTRIGVGADSSQHFVTAGLSFGNVLLNAGVTGRAYEDGHKEIAATLNFTCAVLLAPLAGLPFSD